MTSSPPGKCCTTGIKHEGSPKGTIVKIDSISTYFARLAITKPLSIAAAEIDTIFTAEKRSESEKILSGLKVPYQINLYGAVSHGFALRGDLTVKEVKFATDRTFEQAVTWFMYWL